MPDRRRGLHPGARRRRTVLDAGLVAGPQARLRRRQGPNTGGMGAYSPAPVVTDELWPVIREQVFDRTLAELAQARASSYKGVLYAGLMIDRRPAQGAGVQLPVRRSGDPGDSAAHRGRLLPALEACVDGTLSQDMIAWRAEACVCVVDGVGRVPRHPTRRARPLQGLRGRGDGGRRRLSRRHAPETGNRVDRRRARARRDGAGRGPRRAVERAYAAVSRIGSTRRSTEQTSLTGRWTDRPEEKGRG